MAEVLWNDSELIACIKAYFKMLNYQKMKTPYSKIAVNLELQKELLGKRSKGSIEFRMRNISSVLQEHSLDYLIGYRPAENVGNNVKERIWQIIKKERLI
jgi:5-methylcytosine-specific restriction enzyme A